MGKRATTGKRGNQGTGSAARRSQPDGQQDGGMYDEGHGGEFRLGAEPCGGTDSRVGGSVRKKVR